jgi:hypothetical protein
MNNENHRNHQRHMIWSQVPKAAKSGTASRTANRNPNSVWYDETEWKKTTAANILLGIPRWLVFDKVGKTSFEEGEKKDSGGSNGDDDDVDDVQCRGGF